jgi:hypothetical protein
VPSLADILERYGPAYLHQNAGRVLPSHRKAIADIVRCRTADMEAGGIYRCDDCGKIHYAYRSCGNRHCPQCGHDKIELWLHKQQDLLLPVDYFLVTFTLPHELHAVTYAHQRDVYGAMFSASSDALKELAMDRRFLGAHIGMLGVLQTWKRDLEYHPHIHYLVPGGGLSPDRRQWLYPRTKKFLVHAAPLARLFRGKFRDHLKTLGLESQVPPQTWQKDWVVDCACVGDGRRCLKYLGPYVHRVALSDRRICDVSNDKVTFTYKPSGSNQWTTRTLAALAFIAVFLRHVLPKGFVKVRNYGLLASASRLTLRAIRLLLLTSRSQPHQPSPTSTRPHRCPRCGGSMTQIGIIHSPRGPPR